MAEPSIEIRTLTPELLPQFLHFFDHVAFADNPKWASCYCHYPHAPHGVPQEVKWHDRTAAQNRAASTACITDRRMGGQLAFADGEPVGWCNASRRSEITIVDGPEPLAAQIGSIACFVVAPAWRGRGVAGALLRAACDALAAQGCTLAEAYPLREHGTAAENHLGPLKMYLSAGFARDRDDGDCVIVRKALA